MHPAKLPCVAAVPAERTDDLSGFAFVNEAVISPMGDRVAYAVRRMDLQADRYRAALIVSAVDGSGAASWTDGTADDATPRWSPDGQRLAFVSDRGAVPAGKKSLAWSLTYQSLERTLTDAETSGIGGDR